VGSISHQGLLLNRDGLALVGDPGMRSVDLNNIIRVPVDGALVLEGLLLVLVESKLLSVNLDGPVLDVGLVGLSGTHLNLGLALEDGDVLVSVDFLSEDGVGEVLGAVRGDQVVTLINLVTV